METVTVTDVNKGERGWYEVELEGDDRVLATKDRELADKAFASRGNPITVEIGHKKNGGFDNYYLNKIEEDGETTSVVKPADRPAKPKETASTRTTTRRSPDEDRQKRDEERQKRIEAQWAFGRATELLIASETDFVFPLNEDILKQLAQTALALTVGATELAKR